MLNNYKSKIITRNGKRVNFDYIFCPYCKQQAEWIENKEVYGKNYGNSYMMWLCKPCNAYVGCHNNTKKPLGTMANKELRKLRMIAHEVVDKYWKNGKLDRAEVYRRLSNHFNKTIHIGESDEKTCREITLIADKILC